MPVPAAFSASHSCLEATLGHLRRKEGKLEEGQNKAHEENLMAFCTISCYELLNGRLKAFCNLTHALKLYSKYCVILRPEDLHVPHVQFASHAAAKMRSDSSSCLSPSCLSSKVKWM